MTPLFSHSKKHGFCFSREEGGVDGLLRTGHGAAGIVERVVERLVEVPIVRVIKSRKIVPVERVVEKRIGQRPIVVAG